MFSKNIKLVLIITIFFVMSSFYVMLYASCDMAAMITKTGYSISTLNPGSGVYDDPDEFIDFLIAYSSASTNPDGYGVTYIGENGYFPYINTASPLLIEFYSDQAWYLTAPDINQLCYNYNYYNGFQYPYQGPMEAARTAINDDANDIAIVLGHDRRSNTALGNHPLRFIYDTNTTFQFIHNGGIDDDIKLALYNELGGASWFATNNHPSNWNTNYTHYNQFIDSEILFHWIMSNIMDNDGDVLSGIQDALTATVDNIVLQDEFNNPYYQSYYWHNVVNFVLTDGETLYLFRNGGNNWDHHLLSWEENENNSYTVKTQTELENGLNQFDCVIISRDEEPIVYSNFLEMKIFSEGYNWESLPLLVRDATINEPVDFVPILQTIEPFDDITYIEIHADNEDDPDLVYDYWGSPQWQPGDYDIQSTRLYKIKVDPYAQRTLELSGTRMASNYELEDPLNPNTYQWLGYWLPESRNIVDAFGDYWQYVENVKSEDWYFSKRRIIRGGDPLLTISWSTEDKTLEYGKGYMVMFIETPPITDFHWTESGESEEPVKKATSESFTYTEKSDYEVIDVIDIPANVNEIGVFEDDQCVGAVVVQDSCAQILVYSDNANRDPIPFNFEIVTGRGVSSSISDYKVFNQITGEFEPGIVISGMQEYSIIRFGEEGELEDNIPSVTKLHSNYPNPFNPSTTISFSLPKEENIELTIYNIKGQKVKTLYSGSAEEGKHTMIWEGKDTNDKLVSSGLYFYQLKTKDKELTRKMLLLK